MTYRLKYCRDKAANVWSQTLALKDIALFPCNNSAKLAKWPVYNFNLPYLFRLINLTRYIFRYFEPLGKSAVEYKSLFSEFACLR